VAGEKISGKEEDGRHERGLLRVPFFLPPSVFLLDDLRARQPVVKK
jgi:hypothetical protein